MLLMNHFLMFRALFRFTHRSQSTATSKLMSWVGSPTAVRMSSMVTRPALGILAAPTLARVAVRLEQKHIFFFTLTCNDKSCINGVNTLTCIRRHSGSNKIYMENSMLNYAYLQMLHVQYNANKTQCKM